MSACTPSLSVNPEPFLRVLARRGAEKAAWGPRSFLKLSSVGHQVAWLLGTSCCLTPGGGVCQNCRNCFPCTWSSAPSWRQTVGLPRWPSWPAAPGWMPWLVPGVGPSPGSCAVLFGKALADVVDLNCFLIILSFRAGAASHQPRLQIASLGPLVQGARESLVFRLCWAKPGRGRWTAGVGTK